VLELEDDELLDVTLEDELELEDDPLELDDDVALLAASQTCTKEMSSRAKSLLSAAALRSKIVISIGPPVAK
jgi:hypothetical protein